MTTFFPPDTIATYSFQVGNPEVAVLPYTYPPPQTQVEELSLVPPIEHLIPAGVDPSNTVGAVSFIPADATEVNP